jgi:hypothetical protein
MQKRMWHPPCTAEKVTKPLRTLCCGFKEGDKS